MADLFGIGLSGLKASQTQLAVTGQNITNVNTPGYSRQTAVQVARNPSLTGAGYIGNGTSVVDVQRIQNQFLTNQVRASTAISTEVKAFQTQIEELNILLSGTATGITPGMQNFFDALQTSIEDPASLPARQLFLSEAEGLASRFNTVQERLTVQNRFIGQQMGTVTEQINRLADSVAKYNDSIARASANGKQPNDLLDARDEAIRQLNEFVGVSVVPQDDNTVNLFIGSGQPLVVGVQASTLKVVAGRGDPNRNDVLLVSGGAEQDITNLVSGGELGGLIRYRQEVLDTVLNGVGRLALSIASEVNAQLGQGIDLNGRAGANLFSDINDPLSVELRSRARATNSDPNARLDINISDTAALTTSDYEVVFSSATNFSVRRVSDDSFMGNFDLTSIPPPEIDGFTVSFNSGGIAAGDRFQLTPTRFGAAGMAVSMKQPQELGFAAPAASQASLDNRGNATLTQPQLTASPMPIVPADMQAIMPYQFSYDAGTGELLLNGPSGVATPASFTIQPGSSNLIEWSDGDYSFSMTLRGTPLDGDSFSVDFNTGIADNRNALRLAELQNRAVLGFTSSDAKGFSFVDGYGDIVQRIGTLTAQARSDSESSSAILKQALNNRDSVSAVNLDEEAANLIRFEQYYNASAQVIQVARTLFDTLLSSIR